MIKIRFRVRDAHEEEPLTGVAKFLVYGLLPPFGLYQLYVGLSGLLTGKIVISARARSVPSQDTPAYFFAVGIIALGLVCILGPIYLGLLPRSRRLKHVVTAIVCVMILSILGGYSVYLVRIFAGR